MLCPPAPTFRPRHASHDGVSGGPDGSTTRRKDGPGSPTCRASIGAPGFEPGTSSPPAVSGSKDYAAGRHEAWNPPAGRPAKTRDSTLGVTTAVQPPPPSRLRRTSVDLPAGN